MPLNTRATVLVDVRGDRRKSHHEQGGVGGHRCQSGDAAGQRRLRLRREARKAASHQVTRPSWRSLVGWRAPGRQRGRGARHRNCVTNGPIGDNRRRARPNAFQTWDRPAAGAAAALRRPDDRGRSLEGWHPTADHVDALVALVDDDVTFGDYPGPIPDPLSTRADATNNQANRSTAGGHYLIPGTTLLRNNFGADSHGMLADLEFVSTAGRIAGWHRRGSPTATSAPTT